MKEDTVNYLVSDHEGLFGIRIIFADWWQQYSDEELQEQVDERQRALRYIKAHRKLPEDLNPKFKQVGIPNFLTNAVVPVLKEEYPRSFTLDMSDWKIHLSNGKVLRTVVNVLVLAEMSDLPSVGTSMLELKAKLLNLTHFKEFDMSNHSLDVIELFKTIAKKGQCVVEHWWNTNKGARSVFMPDGRDFIISDDFTSDEYKATRVEKVIAEHYEEMMVHFDMDGITEDTDPATL